MSRPKNADGQRTRQAILDAALDLFADKGFFGTSLRDIATAVGVRESALYNYFPSKDALFEELIVSGQEEKTERLQTIAADAGDARQALERLAMAILESHAQPRQQQLFRVLLSDGLRLARNGRLNLLERMGNDGRGPIHELLRSLMRQGAVRSGDVKPLVIAFISPLLLWRHVRALDADERMFGSISAFAKQHVDHFLHGAAVRSDAATPTRSPRRPVPATRRTPVRRLS